MIEVRITKKGMVFFALSIAMLLSSGLPSQRRIAIYCAGDSTMADKDTTDGKPERGWGMYLHEFFADGVVIRNLAQNGRSTRTFIEEGWWAKIVSELHSGDYVIIQFGHNDDMPSKESYTQPEEYRGNLVRMVQEVRSKGGIPVLCTPVARRKFKAGGVLEDTHTYPHIVREVARDEGVPFVDMLQLTTEWLVNFGDQPSIRFFMNFHPGEHPRYPKGITDNTHYTEAGARKVASLFVDAFKRLKGV